MKMKAMFSLFLVFASLIAAAPVLNAQDLSKYREFSLGASLTTVLKLTDQKPTDVNQAPGIAPKLQELTWWPPSASGSLYRSDSVEQILFSFCDGALYKITVTYDQNSTEGLTAEDMVKSISEKYGPPTTVFPEVPANGNNHYATREKAVANWEDSQRSLNLVRSSFSSRFGLVIYTKRVNADVEIAIKDSAIREQQEGPMREAARQKKQTDDLEVARQKNQKTFRP
jgi:hypothetical protein